MTDKPDRSMIEDEPLASEPADLARWAKKPHDQAGDHRIRDDHNERDGRNLLLDTRMEQAKNAALQEIDSGWRHEVRPSNVPGSDGEGGQPSAAQRRPAQRQGDA